MTQNPTTTTSDPTANPAPERGPVMDGAEILVACLEREGVDTIFAYPGGASMPIHQALTKSTKIRTILPRHEQGGVFAAEGYARATGRAGVCMATSGPGATNLVSGIADAYMDSVPLVAITGQVPQWMIGRGAFQETDVFGMTLPIVKHSYLVWDINDIPRIVKEAFHIAQSGRPGPVLIDLPKNIQQQKAQPIYPTKINLRGYNEPRPAPDEVALNELIGLINGANKPMLYVGGGIITSGAAPELMEFVERTQIPVATTLMGIGCFPENHPLSLKWLGMHGTVYANNAVNEADVLLAMGVRFDDRVTGKVEEFAKHGTIVHIDIDASEINKNKVIKLPIIADVKVTLRAAQRDSSREAGWERTPTGQPWPFSRVVRDDSQEWKAKFPLRYTDAGGKIQPQYAIELLQRVDEGRGHRDHGRRPTPDVGGDSFTIIVHAALVHHVGGPGRDGLRISPAAMGAKVACPEREVIDIDGDGSFLMNVQELACAKVEGIAAKAIILNNQHLGMVVQWEDRFYQSNRGHTVLSDPKQPGVIYP